VVMVVMMFSFRSSPPRLAADHTGDERAGAGWTARGKYPWSAPGVGRAGGSGAAGTPGPVLVEISASSRFRDNRIMTPIRGGRLSEVMAHYF
jgi:hypothetical protein